MNWSKQLHIEGLSELRHHAIDLLDGHIFGRREAQHGLAMGAIGDVMTSEKKKSYSSRSWICEPNNFYILLQSFIFI